MSATILDDIPFEVDPRQLAQSLGAAEDLDLRAELETLIQEAGKVARPRAVYRACFVESRTDDETVIDGVVFRSRVLTVNFENIHRVFPFVVTCGRELQEWSDRLTDPLLSFQAEEVKELALHAAHEYLGRHLDQTYGLARSSHMNPGSLPDWPLPQQYPLFSLLGDVEAAIGVTLTESCLMLPTKSVSGIRFPTETTFESCQLCPREACPNRRAAWDPDLFEARYRKGP
jgi:hypothetical protein